MNTVTEKNQAIANFMAGKEVETNHNKYHENWNELMPVIEKIGQDTDYTLVMEENTSYWVNQGDYGVDNAQFGGYSAIGNIYDAVVEFIQWWNKSQTSESPNPKLFEISGHYADDKTEVEGLLITSFHDVLEEGQKMLPGYSDDDIFYYGLSESEIKQLIKTKEPLAGVVIEAYVVVE